MLKNKMQSLKKLAKSTSLRKNEEASEYREKLLFGESESRRSTTPRGFVAVYVGDEFRRFVIPTSFLSHPLFRMVLRKAYEEFDFDQKSGLAVPCSVSAFQKILSSVEDNNGRFEFGELVDEFL